MSVESRETTTQIPWPTGIDQESSDSLLGLNKRGAELRRLIAEHLYQEGEDFEVDLPETDGFSSLYFDLSDTLEFLFGGKYQRVEEIVDEIFVLGRKGKLQDSLSFLGGKFDELFGISTVEDIDTPSDVTRDLVEIIDWVEVLKQDPTGFRLVDYLAEKSPNVLPSYPDYQRAISGRKKAAERYKELYNLLVEAGATPDS